MTKAANGKGVPGFPHAPGGWTQADAVAAAQEVGLEPGEPHWEVIRALQEFFCRHEEGSVINSRELHDALEERFHKRGGMKYLYELFPGGPVNQGCRVAGLQAPVGSVDLGFGSVQ